MKVRWSGLGWLCPVDETHKMMYWIPATYDGIMSGYYYCAHADHSPAHGVREYTKNIWRESEIEALRIAIDSEAEKE